MNVNPVEPEDDPHASKISPDDPRLRIERPRSRMLKTKPIVASIVLLLAAGGYAVASSAKKTDSRKIIPEPAAVPERPIVPAFLQEAPETPTTTPGENQQDAFEEPVFPPRAQAPAFGPGPRVDPEALRAAAERARLDEQALSAGLFFESSSGQSSRQPASAESSTAGGDRAGSAPPRAVANGSDSLPPEAQWDPNLQGRKNAFIDSPRWSPDYLTASLQPAFSPYELKATSIIPATLITGINSDLPGPIIAQVREAVYDTVSGQHLLIPQGARLLATYDSMVAWGQERVLLCWNRIIFPNGDSINIQCMPAADLQGQAGLTDEVDEHWDRLFAAVALSTVLSLGVQASAGNPTGYQPTLAQSAASNASDHINSIGQGMVQRQLNIQPTITVRPGFGVNVIVTKDLVLKPYVD